MSRSYRKIIRNRKHRIERRLEGKAPVHRTEEGGPVMSASNIHYEMAEKTQGIEKHLVVAPQFNVFESYAASNTL